jgi:nicotinate-nucleotide pyrophosphorylase (carboxylating)
LLLDVEVCSEAEADEAIDAGADIVMLDNMEGDELFSVARRLKEKWKGQRTFMLETSGNITEANLQERAINGGCLNYVFLEQRCQLNILFL